MESSRSLSIMLEIIMDELGMKNYGITIPEERMWRKGGILHCVFGPQQTAQPCGGREREQQSVTKEE